MKLELIKHQKKLTGPFLRIALFIMLLVFSTGCPEGQVKDGDALPNLPNVGTDDASGGSHKMVFAEYKYREPLKVIQEGNRLINAESVYLKQHAHNPVDWYPWGDEALERAKSEDKPIFLSIGYSSCHWCHVMEEEVFEDEEVAKYLNMHFVCIKVDREERPDLDAVYMNALQMLSGGGGWPMSMFLTPDLKPFFGDTYMPKATFMQVSKEVINRYTSDPAKLREVGTELHAIISAQIEPSGGQEIGSRALNELIAQGEGVFDTQHGGFFAQRKFPTPLRWRFMLHYYRKTGNEAAAGMVRKTLDEMAAGGLYDQLGGGFHRYCTDRVWLVPHFEKMLYDNAQLAGLYTEASVVFDDPSYARIAQETLDFMVSEMSSGDGQTGFYASYDADSGGVEGTYYIWRPEELNEAAGTTDGPVLAAMLGVSTVDNFQDYHGDVSGSVLTRRARAFEVASQFGLDTSTVADMFDRYRSKLLEVRANRTPPGLDTKVVTAWNGLAISALAQGYGVFGDKKYLDAAKGAASFLWTTHRNSDGELARSSTGGDVSGSGVIDDYSFFANGLLDLYFATGEFIYLEQAITLVEYTHLHFSHPDGGYYFTPESLEAPLGRQVLLSDAVEPSGNSVMLHVLQKVAALTGNTQYYSQLDSMQTRFSGDIQRGGYEMAWWFDAALLSAGPYYEVVIAGDEGVGDVDGLLHAVRSMAAPNVVLATIPSEGATSEVLKILLVADQKTAAADGAPLAYVCQKGSCKSPTSSKDKLVDQLQAGWEH